MTGSEKNGNGTAEFKGLLNDRISWDGCMDKKERLTTRNGIKEKVPDFPSENLGQQGFYKKIFKHKFLQIMPR